MATHRDPCGGCSRRDALRGLTALAFSFVPVGGLVSGCTDAGDAGDPADAARPDAARPDAARPDAAGADATAPDAADLPEPDAAAAEPDAAVLRPDAEPPADCAGNLCIDLTDPANADLNRVGGSGYADVPGGDTVIVMRDTADAFVTLSAICTHRGCRIEFQGARHNLRCGCHGAMFSLDGSVTQGPASSPLRVYRNEQIGQTLVVYLS
jgi:Rieske Fe-S protein